MSAIMCDSFDHYATAEILQKWPSSIITVGSSNITINASGRNAQGAKQTYSANNGDMYLRRAVTTSGATAIAGFAFHTNNFADSSDTRNGILSFLSGATVLSSLRVNSSGSISVMRGTSAGTVLATSAAGVVPLSTWTYIEFKVLLSATVGTYEVRVNGVNVLSGTGANTASATTWDGVSLFGNTSNLWITASLFIDDFYCLDGSGASNNDFLGPIRVKAILPDGAGASTDFTPSAGSNFQNVDETLTDGDTTYNSETLAGDHDTYTYAALGVTGAVKFLQTNLAVRSDAAGAETVAPMIRIGVTDYQGTTVSLTTSYTDKMQVYNTSPATAVAWTVAEIDGAEFGAKLVS